MASLKRRRSSALRIDAGCAQRRTQARSKHESVTSCRSDIEDKDGFAAAVFRLIRYGVDLSRLSNAAQKTRVDLVQMFEPVRADLEAVAADMPVVTFNHIPFVSAVDMIGGYQDDGPAPMVARDHANTAMLLRELSSLGVRPDAEKLAAFRVG